MQFRNCTEIRFLFLTLNYIKYLKDKLFWVSILDDASSWNSILFSQWQNQIVESFFGRRKVNLPPCMKRTNVCGKRWTTRVFLLSVINFGFCQSGRVQVKSWFLVPNPSHRILIDAFSNLIFVIVLTVHFQVTTHGGLGLVSSPPLFASLQQFCTGCTAFFYWSLHR